MASPSDIVLKYIRPGDVLVNRYEIERFVDAGAYGAIFSAIDQVTMERVAVKAVPPAEEGTSETAIGRFQREMKVISALRHPNIINLYDFGETEDRIIFMVLEFIDGQTLYEMVEDRPLTFDAAISVTRQIALALGVAHSQGVIHRDLKPQNIMLIPSRGGDFEVKVLDFGMAKVLERLGDESIIALTREGIAVGTPRYIAPEQARGKQVGPYSDLYALGLLCYEMFTGQRAVKADSVETAIMAHVSRKPLVLDEIELVPVAFRSVLHRLLEKDHTKRYQVAAEVVEDLAVVHRSHWERGAPTQKLENIDSPPGAAPQSKASNLEVDYEKARDVPGKPKRPRRTPKLRFDAVGASSIPKSRFQWFQFILALFLALAVFLLLPLQFPDTHFLGRTTIGLFPLIFAFLLNIFVQRPGWAWGYPRLLLYTSSFFFFIAHIMGMGVLAVGLKKTPVWFLEPFLMIPGVWYLKAFVSYFTEIYVWLLMAVSSNARETVELAAALTG